MRMKHKLVVNRGRGWLWGMLPAWALLWLTLAVTQVATGTNRSYGTLPPIFDARTLNYQPVPVFPLAAPDLFVPIAPSDTDMPVTLAGPAFAQPGEGITYTLTLLNAERFTRTYDLTVTLPTDLVYVPGSSPDLTHDAVQQTLKWQGELPPGHLTYIVEMQGAHLPYLDLAEFGAPNLCDDFIAATGSCAAVSVTFNLGSSGYAARLFGQRLHQLTVSTDGLVHGASAMDAEDMLLNRWLPDAVVPGPLLAGLWRPVDLTAGGRWHAAIVSGLIAGYDVFYVQWHDAPAAADPSLTARHAIVIVLEGDGEAAPAPLAGQVFFLYDNISDPTSLVAQGYTIGVADRIGERGLTHAFAPSHGDSHPPQGTPPDAGTTLHLRPIWAEAGQPYQRIFRYQAIVQATVPDTLAQTATVRSSSPDPTLTFTWDTHYLAVRWQTYLPMVNGE